MTRRSESSSSEWPWGAGLALFEHHRGAARRHRIAFVAIFLTVAALLTWPLYPELARLEPFVLGMPFGFAWVVGCLIIMFAGLVWLYRADRRSGARDRTEASSRAMESQAMESE